MKKLAIFTAVAVLVFGLANVARASEVDLGCNPITVDLQDSSGMDVGDIAVTCPNANTLTMTFNVDDPYILLEIHGFVEDNDPLGICPGVEITKMGNPKVDTFPESMLFKQSDRETAATLTFDIYGFQPGPACGVGHADLKALRSRRPFVEAWSVGTPFPNPENGEAPGGAAHFNINIVDQTTGACCVQDANPELDCFEPVTLAFCNTIPGQFTPGQTCEDVCVIGGPNG